MATGQLRDNQHTITIITANIGFKTGKTYVRGDPCKSKRAFKTLVDNEKPALVFLQESKLKKIEKKYEFSSEYVSERKGSDDKFLYDNTAVKLKLINLREMEKIRDREFKDVASYLPLENISMALVSTSLHAKSKPDMLCVSWHGPYTEEDLDLKKKMEILKVMLRFVKSFSEMHDLPFIIGGGFNLEIAGAKKVLENFHDMEVYDYDIKRRPNRVDYFISSKSLTLIDVKPVPWNDVEAKRILDHDPIIAKILKPIKDEPNKSECGNEDSLKKLDIQEKPKRKKKDTAYVKEESEKEMEKFIKTKIAEEYMETIEKKVHKTIKKYCKESSEDSKKDLTKKIVEEFEEKMEEFKNK